MSENQDFVIWTIESHFHQSFDPSEGTSPRVGKLLNSTQKTVRISTFERTSQYFSMKETSVRVVNLTILNQIEARE